MIDQTELDRLRALADAATNDDITLYRSTALSEKTYQLGKAARTAIPALIAEIERLTGELRASNAENARHDDTIAGMQWLTADLSKKLSRVNTVLFKLSDISSADLSAARMKAENLEAEVERLTRERDEARAGRRIISNGAMDLGAVHSAVVAERDAALAQRDRLREALKGVIAAKIAAPQPRDPEDKGR